MVSTADRWKGTSVILGIIFIIILCASLLLTLLIPSFAIFAVVSLLGMLACMFMWVIAEGIDLCFGTDFFDALKKYWKNMMGRDN